MKNRLKNKKQILTIAVIAVLLLTLPLTLILVRQNQDSRSRASYTVEAFLASSTGVNVIEAIHTDERKANGSPYIWENKSLDGVSYIQANPNDNNIVYGQTQLAQSTEAKYNIYFPAAGTYYFYARTSGNAQNADSFHFGLNGNFSGTHNGHYENEGTLSSVWSWTKTNTDGTRSKVIVPSVGFHIFHIWMRESGTRVHRFRIVTSSTWAPVNHSDWGPTDETVRGTITVGTPTPGPTSGPTSTPTPTKTPTPTPVPTSPDLVVSSVTNWPTQSNPGQIINPTIRICNQGNAGSGQPFRVRLRSIDTATGENKTIFHDETSSGISAGACRDYNFANYNQSLQLPTTPGSYKGQAYIDPSDLNQVKESNENNNAYLVNYSIVAQATSTPTPKPTIVQNSPTPKPTTTPNTPTPYPTFAGSSPTPIPTLNPTCPIPPSDTGSVTMSVLVKGGTYKIWSRMKASNSTNNAYFVRVGDNCPMIVGDSSAISTSSWTWVDYKNGNTNDKMTVTLSAGSHIITLYGYEENVDVDKLLLTTSQNCVPTTTSGDNCPAEAVVTPTSSPTTQPTNTPVPTNILTPTSAPTPQPNDTVLRFGNIKLHGIGYGGDNTTPNSVGNLSPRRTTRTLSVELIDASGNTLPADTGTIAYNSSTGNFSGDVIISSSVNSGEYLVRVKVPQFLKKRAVGIYTLTKGTVNTVSTLELTTGDMNNDNALSLADYNILTDCYSDLLPAKNCSDQSKKQSADLSDDGNVNANDYNLFLRELSVVAGD